MSSPLPEPISPTQKKDRIKFGVGSLLYNADETAFSPMHTAIIRALGGGDVALGVIGSVMPSAGRLFSWIGTLFLKLTKLHRQAQIVALITSGVIQGLIVATLLVANVRPGWAGVLLVAYMALVGLMASISGAQLNIAMSWIGELVPNRRRGWFVSGMAIISNVGLVLLQLLFAWLAKDAGLPEYALIMGIVMINTVAACFLVATITNREAKVVNFVSSHHGERVNYRHKPMWCLIWFECAWSSGRVSLVAFSTAYLMDHFGYGMSRVILIHMLVNLVNIVMLFFMGRLSDRIGIYRPLAVITTLCASSMLLWVSSAWWGILPIIAYQMINGAAGSTHWMLVTNLSLEVYPSRGRSNYLAFGRVVLGIFVIVVGTLAGYLMSGMRGWSMDLWGSEFSYYHLFFLGCTLATMTSLLPLYLLRLAKPAVDEEEAVVEPRPPVA